MGAGASVPMNEIPHRGPAGCVECVSSRPGQRLPQAAFLSSPTRPFPTATHVAHHGRGVCQGRACNHCRICTDENGIMSSAEKMWRNRNRKAYQEWVDSQPGTGSGAAKWRTVGKAQQEAVKVADWARAVATADWKVICRQRAGGNADARRSDEAVCSFRARRHVRYGGRAYPPCTLKYPRITRAWRRCGGYQ